MNCKQGDLAIVIYAVPSLIDWIGRVVEVGRFHHGMMGPAWQVSWCGEKPKSCFDSDIHVVHDSSLRPVSGLPMEEDVRDEIKEKA